MCACAPMSTLRALIRSRSWPSTCAFVPARVRKCARFRTPMRARSHPHVRALEHHTRALVPARAGTPMRARWYSMHACWYPHARASLQHARAFSPPFARARTPCTLAHTPVHTRSCACSCVLIPCLRAGSRRLVAILGAGAAPAVGGGWGGASVGRRPPYPPAVRRWSGRVTYQCILNIALPQFCLRMTLMHQ